MTILDHTVKRQANRAFSHRSGEVDALWTTSEWSTMSGRRCQSTTVQEVEALVRIHTHSLHFAGS